MFCLPIQEKFTDCSKNIRFYENFIEASSDLFYVHNEYHLHKTDVIKNLDTDMASYITN